MMTLQDYADEILKPSLVAGIKSGSLDATFSDPVCLIIMIKDKELREALIERLIEMENE